jgi:UDP-glucose 4-epimerase
MSLDPTQPRRDAPPDRVLVTGGAGFIGSHLVDALLARWPHARITVIDDLSTGSMANLAGALRAAPERVRLIQSDLIEALPGLAGEEPFDRLYHLAAAVGVQRVVDDPIGCIETNVEATAALLRYAVAQGGPPVLLASSSEVYGKSPASPFREDDDCVYGPTTAPRWSYAASKAIDEYLALAHHRTSRLPVVIVRFFNTVGPRQVGDYGMVLPRFIQAAMENRSLTVFGDGSQTRCFCDVRDIVPAVIDLLEAGADFQSPACGQVFNLGADRPISIDDLARLVIAQLGSSSPLEHVPFERAMGTGFEDLTQRRPDLQRVRSAIDFEPRISLKQTVQDIADSLRLKPASGGVGA